ncbi:hypothetical protein [Rhizobium leguminosarum]|uniref:hypothetical protein n=1 Tax=Rhizobium leguminosarum TaxID=384 RepID=UPI00037D8F79|nr:hypothetical protein [Rhizobium leguminosarum]
MDIDGMLKEIADKGGPMEVVEDHYYPLDVEAELLGLISKEYHGGDLGFTETLSLTNKGRQHLGIDVVTPHTWTSAASTFARIIAKFTRPILYR